MQLEQQENFTIHGPQLEILGEVETKLPAPAKKRGTASIVLVALALVSVLGIGGAKLKGVYRETAEIYTSAQDEYGHSIQGDFEAQADAAANLIKQAGYVDMDTLQMRLSYRYLLVFLIQLFHEFLQQSRFSYLFLGLLYPKYYLIYYLVI